MGEWVIFHSQEIPLMHYRDTPRDFLIHNEDNLFTRFHPLVPQGLFLSNWPEGPIGEAEGRAYVVRAKRDWIRSNLAEGPIDEAEGRVHLGCI